MRKRTKAMLIYLNVCILCISNLVSIPPTEPSTKQIHATTPTTTKPIATQQVKEKVRLPPNLNIPLDEELKTHIYEQCSYDDDVYCFVMAVIKNESSFDIDAVSSDGHDHGLMQLRDFYYDELIEDYDILNPKEPFDNVTVGIAMLQEYLDKYGYKNLALMCYNCGEYGAKRLWNDGVYSTNYTVKVLNDYEEYMKELKE